MTQMLLPLKPFMCNHSIRPHWEVCAQACQLCKCVPGTPRRQQQPSKEERTTQPGWGTHHAPQCTLLSQVGSVEVWSSVSLLQSSELRHQGTAWQQLLLVCCRNRVAILVRPALAQYIQHTQWARLGQCSMCWASVPPACSHSWALRPTTHRTHCLHHHTATARRLPPCTPWCFLLLWAAHSMRRPAPAANQTRTYRPSSPPDVVPATFCAPLSGCLQHEQGSDSESSAALWVSGR